MNPKLMRRLASITEHELPNHLHPVLKRIYLNRGIAKAAEIERGLENLLSFESLLGINVACQLLYQALVKQKRILIVGDFDADGATSTAVAMLALKALGAKHVSYIVPNRFEYGYGLTPEIVEVALAKQPDVLITVDNGISSFAGVEFAKRHGIEVLITDHHLPGAQLPAADAIVNPNQPGCPFPSKNMAGVGVIFYVMLALRHYLRSQNWFAEQQISEPQMANLLDLVALGTYSDVVPLDQNNRILVYQGLMRIRAGKCRIGIQVMLDLAGRQIKNIDASTLGFVLGPRLNAAGRLDDMSIGIECLLTSDEVKARQIAKTLEELNRERRAIETGMKEEAFDVIEKLQRDGQNQFPAGLCLFDETWHQGVIGIVAGRVKDTFHRPTIAFAACSADEIKGSARSIEGIHIRDILDTIAAFHPEMLTKFGGHAMAAGLTLKKSDFKAFSAIFAETIQAKISLDEMQKKIWSDGELDTEHFNLLTVEEIRAAGPFGQAFPEPLFDGVFEIVQQRLLNERHLKLTLKKGARHLDAICFHVNRKLWPNYDVKHIHAAYRLDINHYNGTSAMQLIIEYIEPYVE